MTLKLNHLHIKTGDPEKTAKFYVAMFGAKILTPGPRNGYRLDLLGLHLNVTPFLEEQKREQGYGMEHLAIDTDELDAAGGRTHRCPGAGGGIDLGQRVSRTAGGEKAIPRRGILAFPGGARHGYRHG